MIGADIYDDSLSDNNASRTIGFFSSSEKDRTIQRKQRLQSMVHKRKWNLQYLKKVHEGGLYFLNCTLLTKSDIRRFTAEYVSPARANMYLCLSMSTSALLDQQNKSHAYTVRAFLQMLEEFEYHFAGPTVQSMKSLMARNASSMYPQTSTFVPTRVPSSPQGNLNN